MSESVLVVEGDPVVRVLLGNALFTQLPQARVTLFGRGDEALASLAKQAFNVALVDGDAKLGSGEPLRLRLAEEHPHLPVLLLGRGGAGDPPIPSHTTVFKRPLSIDAVVGQVIHSLAESASGELYGIGLPAFLQLVELERKTCAVLVRDEDRAGSFVFERGLVIHARQGDLVGETAAMEMLCWPQPHLLVREASAPPRNVTMRLSQLILEAFRMFDERSMGIGLERAPGSEGEVGKGEGDGEPPVLPCTAEELLELAPGVVHGLLIRRRTGKILLQAGDAMERDAPSFARAVARAHETAAFAAAPGAVAELVSSAGAASTLVWPSLKAPGTLIVLVMKKQNNTAFALAGQRLRLRGW